MSYHLSVHQKTDIVSLKDPPAVFQEVMFLMEEVSPANNLPLFVKLFGDIQKLYVGRYPGYRACNIHYHDFGHIMNVLLALARLIHGAKQKGLVFSRQSCELALAAALLHDAGYIQTKKERKGTGAQYTDIHVDRSIKFAKAYFGKHHRTAVDFQKVRQMILCTSLTVSVDKIHFSSDEIRQLGLMLGSADLIGQMADREYLERLLFLYLEFKEGRIGNYSSEADLLKRTIGFFDFANDRLLRSLGGVQEFMIYHFKSRWKINKDLYSWYIRKNRLFLKSIIRNHKRDYRKMLKRGGVVEKLKTKRL